MIFFNKNIGKFIKSRLFFGLLLVLFVTSSIGVYFYYNPKSMEENHENFVIFEEDAEAAAIAAADPTMPEGGITAKGYHIHVNLDTKQLYVYKDGQFVKSYPCSGGKRSTPSPEGTWKIISKGEWGEGFGGAWMGFNVPWGKYGIHGTVEPRLIGKTNASEGCIRMLNKDVRELYKYIPYGTTVTIIQENKPFRVMKNGDIGSDVKTLQKNLAKLGYYKGSTDGKYGGYLKSCVEKFQKDNRIYTSGALDKKTSEAIKRRIAELEGTPTN